MIYTKDNYCSLEHIIIQIIITVIIPICSYSIHNNICLGTISISWTRRKSLYIVHS